MVAAIRVYPYLYKTGNTDLQGCEVDLPGCWLYRKDPLRVSQTSVQIGVPCPMSLKLNVSHLSH